MLLELEREQVTRDVYHYSFLLKVGETPNAHLRIHRVIREQAPGRPRPTVTTAMLLHGDFSTFTSNFVPSLAGTATPKPPGLAVYLAERGVDVWGFDRRWTTAPAGQAGLSDFANMGFASAMDDIERALQFAMRGPGRSGQGSKGVILVGFSRGAQLAYAYAAEESQRPAGRRYIQGLVPIDIYGKTAPEDEALRQAACNRRDEERAQLAAGLYDSDNSFFIDMGTFARAAPSAPSPIFPGLTNRGAMVALTAQTFLFYAPTPHYHMAASVLEEDGATALRYSPEPVVADWLASAPPHQALAELADGDALWCGQEPLPLAAPLDRISVPLFYLGAAGGFGSAGLYTTTLVRSTDVTTHVVRRLEAGREAEDFGHADLLYALDAPALAWQPLTEWMLRH
ncbi:alpha/beta hydrolase [Archangium gephyra]|uniref:alpha/beta hydrolase n=1 Tax=Archangium gephyra TaxID=48 RepID=UPI0035D43DA0